MQSIDEAYKKTTSFTIKVQMLWFPLEGFTLCTEGSVLVLDSVTWVPAVTALGHMDFVQAGNEEEIKKL